MDEYPEGVSEGGSETVYYLSMEFLMGRALGNNLINLQAYEDVAEALEELGNRYQYSGRSGTRIRRWATADWDVWRLVSWIPWQPWAVGLWMRDQIPLRNVQTWEIRDGYRIEVPDNWLADGNPLNSAVRSMPRRSSSADMLMFLWMKTDATALSRKAISL